MNTSLRRNFLPAPRTLTALLVLLLPFAAFSQEPSKDTGVQFEHGLSWTAIQARAKAENKYIFMDCYTTWCGPCRFMSTTIFPQKVTGDYVNDKFISVAVQLDTTAKDADPVKAWYQDGHDLAAKYNIHAYPTYLIFAPDGQVVHRMVGSTLDAASFIQDLGAAFDTTRQYYTQLRQFEDGRRDTAFLRRLTLLSLDAYDGNKARKIASVYLKTQGNLFQPGVLDIIYYVTERSTDEYFPFLAGHMTEIDKATKPGFAEGKVREIYITEGTGRHQGDNRPPNWDSLHAKIAARLPGQAGELTARVRINYYRSRKDWTNFEKAMVGYMKAYGSKMDEDDLNGLAWATFQGCSDMTCVSHILDWSVKLKNSKNPEFMDTYANILYKLGKRDDAIALEQKALYTLSNNPQANDQAKADMRSTIDKMKKGEKTWD